MVEAKKRGPLTYEELLALWVSSNDSAYTDPLLQAGLGDGFELTAQMFEQMKLISESIDESFQSLFISPWSAQTDIPATGRQRSQVTLSITRDRMYELPLIFLPQQIVAQEQTDDFGPNGPVPTLTGRLYASGEINGLLPGEASKSVLFASQRAGKGFDLPLPGTIRTFHQPGARLTNTGATLILGIDSPHALVCAPRADAPTPDMVGSYLAFIAGANTGRVVRIAGYTPPPILGTDGGTLTIAPMGVYVLSLLAGTFIAGETIKQFPSNAEGIFLMTDGNRFVLDRTRGVFVTAQSVVGQTSGAQAVFATIDVNPDLIGEAATAQWIVLSWKDDLGLTVTNVELPTGGRAATLDEIGHERGLLRDLGESTDNFRIRVSKLADTISPNAIRRTVNRLLAPSGRSGCVREVGYEAFRGMFYDGDLSSVDPAIAFAYDFDFNIRPQDRFKLQLNYEEFRAFFLVGVPASNEGEFGIAYDSGYCNAYDAAPWLAFYDGFAVGAAIEAREIWRAVDKSRAYGVGFDLYRDVYYDCPLP